MDRQRLLLLGMDRRLDALLLSENVGKGADNGGKSDYTATLNAILQSVDETNRDGLHSRLKDYIRDLKGKGVALSDIRMIFITVGMNFGSMVNFDEFKAATMPGQTPSEKEKRKVRYDRLKATADSFNHFIQTELPKGIKTEFPKRSSWWPWGK
jgi:hypothetical protein